MLRTGGGRLFRARQRARNNGRGITDTERRALFAPAALAVRLQMPVGFRVHIALRIRLTAPAAVVYNGKERIKKAAPPFRRTAAREAYAGGDRIGTGAEKAVW